MKYINITEAPLALTGLAIKEENKFWRLPEDIVDKVNGGVSLHGRQTSGACVRFRTNSKHAGIKAIVANANASAGMSLIGEHGCDIYVDGKFGGIAFPGAVGQNEYEGIVASGANGISEIRINLPIYSTLLNAWVVVDDDAVVEAPTPFEWSKPVAFYGSSITQGGCAAHPGNTFCALLSKRLGFELIDLGFSGSGCGEPIVANYIASLDLGAFVLDYDHNAPNPEHLRATHHAFYKIIRDAHPELPIIMMTKPDFDNGAEQNAIRRDIVRESYELALSEGDKLVRFIDGETFFGTDEARQHCTVDGCHPNDLGFDRMAKIIAPVLNEFKN